MEGLKNIAKDKGAAASAAGEYSEPDPADIAKNLPVPEGMDEESFQQKAKEIWSMLDDMSKNDPQGYQEFVGQQLKEAQVDSSGRTVIPTPGYVIKTVSMPLNQSEKSHVTHKYQRKLIRGKFMINLCSHKIIAPPQLSDGQVVADKEGNVRVNNIENKTTDMSVPFAIGPVRVTEDKSGSECFVCDVLVNPWTVKFSKEHQTFKNDLIQLVLYWVGQEYDIGLSDDYKLPATSYKGGTKNSRGNIEPTPFELPRSESDKSSEESDGSLSSPQALMKQVVSARENSQSGKTEMKTNIDKQQQEKSPSIEEVETKDNNESSISSSNAKDSATGSSETNQDTGKGRLAGTQATEEKPSTSLGYFETDDGSVCLDFTVQLKGRIQKMSEAALDISEELIQLQLPSESGTHQWQVQPMLEDVAELSSNKFKPQVIDTDAVKAKFSKKSGNLRITIRCLQ